MKDKGVNLHKRIACGDTIKGYAKGGKVAVGGGPVQKVAYAHGGKVGAGAGVDAGSSGRATRSESPLTQARRNNGVVGMKGGGKC